MVNELPSLELARFIAAVIQGCAPNIGEM
jgi:hypothetical protein